MSESATLLVDVGVGREPSPFCVTQAVTVTVYATVGRGRDRVP